jgi:hypothetical protein
MIVRECLKKVVAGFPACRCSGFQPQVGWRTGGKIPPSLATKMVAATFADRLCENFGTVASKTI